MNLEATAQPSKPPTASQVLVLHNGPGSAQRYRCLHLCEQLELQGIACRVVEFRRQPLSGSAAYQVVILHRIPLDKYLARLVRQVRQQGGLVLFDTDDLIFDSAQTAWVRSLAGASAFKQALYREEVRRYREMLLATDGALVSTDFLQQQIARLNKPAWVHRNAFSLEMLHLSEQARRARQPDRRRLVIGYASGTPTHDRDFETVKPALQQILREFEQAELWLIGELKLGSGWEAWQGRIRQLPFVPWQDLPAQLAQFDINLAPLEAHNPFCQAKSEVKYLEAALLGVPTVATATEAYRPAIRHGENGLLAASETDWLDGLRRLARAPELRAALGRRAYEDVQARYQPEQRGKELIATLNQICASLERAPLQPGATRRSAETVETDGAPSLWQKTLYAVRYRGWRVFLLQFAEFLRRHLTFNDQTRA